MRLPFAIAALLLTTAPALPQQQGGFTVTETGRRFASLQDAVSAIGEGRGTIRVAPGRYGDCAVQEAGDIAYTAEVPGKAIFDQAICEGKATLVLRGRSAKVDGIVFTRTLVEDGNGAGIRLETGDLAATRCSSMASAASSPPASRKGASPSIAPPLPAWAMTRPATAPTPSMSAPMAASASPARASNAAPAAII